MSTNDSPRSYRPIVIVTGANGGVGFGICHRLLLQLLQASPPDCLLEGGFPPSPLTHGLSLVLACRNASRAAAAKAKLLKLVDAWIEEPQRTEEERSFAQGFRQDLVIDFVKCDLSLSEAVFEFCDEILKRYPYVSHLVLNAGGMSFDGLNWIVVAKQLWQDPLGAISYPQYKIQLEGELNSDGYGATWMNNVFGHFITTRELQPVLGNCPAQPARVLWMSSREAEPQFFDIQDWQLTHTMKSYEASKYEMDLLAMASNEADTATGANVRHVLVHPSVTVSDILTGHMMFGTFFNWLFWALCTFARICGSSVHVITPFNGAVSSTYTILVPNSVLPSPKLAVKLGSRIRRTETYVEWEPILGWENRRQDGTKLFEKCQGLYESIRARRRAQLGSSTKGSA